MNAFSWRHASRLFTLALCLAGAVLTASEAVAEEPVACGATLTPDDVLRRLNDARARGRTCRPAGERVTGAPLAWSSSLAAAALVQAREMALLNRMGHRDSENRGLGERLRSLGYRFSAAAENVAVGYPSLDEVVDAWLESEGHCENLMNAAVLELGLACIDGSAAGAREERRFWTLVLGAPPRTR